MNASFASFEARLPCAAKVFSGKESTSVTMCVGPLPLSRKLRRPFWFVIFPPSLATLFSISVAGGAAPKPELRHEVQTGEPDTCVHLSIEIDCDVPPAVFTCTNPTAFNSFKLNSAQELVDQWFPSAEGPSTSCPGQ